MALIGVAGENAQFVALVDQCCRFEAKSSQFFDAFDSLIVLIICSDAYISRSDDSRADNDNDRRTNRLLYPLIAGSNAVINLLCMPPPLTTSLFQISNS